MSQPDNTTWIADTLSYAKAIIGMLLLFFTGLLTWIVKREAKRIDDMLVIHTAQIGELQNKRVTIDDLDELRASLTATVTHAFDRMEGQINDRHRDNHDDIQYIRERLDKALDKK